MGVLGALRNAVRGQAGRSPLKGGSGRRAAAKWEVGPVGQVIGKAGR